MNYMMCADHAARMDEMMIEYRLLMTDADCNRWLRRDNCDQQNNIKVDYILTGWERVEGIGVAEGRDDWRCCWYCNDGGPFSTDFMSQSYKPEILACR